MEIIFEFAGRAAQISQAIRDLSADMIAEGDKNKYMPVDLDNLDKAINSLEGRVNLLKEALFELSVYRWKRSTTAPLKWGPIPLTEAHRKAGKGLGEETPGGQE